MTGAIRYWDSAAERLFGWPAGVILGEQAGELLIPDRVRDEGAAIFARLAAGRVWSGRLPFRRRDGEEILVDLVDTPINGLSGELVAIVGVHRLAGAPLDRLFRWDDQDDRTGAQGTLTVRELEVVRHVAQGRTNREIGVALGITTGSVSNHIERIFMKVNLNRRTLLATWAVNQGLWGPDLDPR
jgi:PAS domain S-box-containing protein